VLLLWWLVGCGSVSEVPADGGGGAPQDAAGAAGAAGGASGGSGAPGAAGASAGGRGGAAGTVATAGASGTAGGGAAGTAGGVSTAPCPADWAVQRGCSASVQGAPCDVCHDVAGTPLRCATSAVATARVFCVPDCASCY
jgi:hypothetical protein